MSIYPVITKEKQTVYEKMYSEMTSTKNNIPCICGYYGRACRRMGDKADRMLCQDCTLCVLASTIDEITKKCREKNLSNVNDLSKADIYDIEEALYKKNVYVECSYIEAVLYYLTSE